MAIKSKIDVSFFLVMVRTRKKLEKYFKINKIRKKQIVDIRKLIEEENLDLSIEDNLSFFKVLVWNKIKMAKDKNKDIYYIPNYSSNDLEILKLLKIKTTLFDNENDFNLLCFHDEFIGTTWLNDIMNNIDSFDNVQILKDY